MGRASIVIKKEELEKEIVLAESQNTFDNQSRLFEFICQTDWAKTIKDSLGRPKAITPINIYQRIKEFKIPLKTVAGKKGVGILACKTRVRRQKSYPKNFLSSVPKEYSSLANRVKSGSLKAAIKMKCLECSNYQPKEVKHCPCTDCPLYPFLQRADPKILENSEKGT